MDAVDKCQDDPIKDIWIGEAKEFPEIIAILERDYDEDYYDNEIELFKANIHREM